MACCCSSHRRSAGVARHPELALERRVRHRCRRLGRSHPAIVGGLEQLAPIGFVEHMLAVVVEQLAAGWLVRKLAVAAAQLVRLEHKSVAEQLAVGLEQHCIAGIELELVGLGPVERIAELEPVELGPVERIADIEPGLVGLALELAERIAAGIGPGLVALAVELVVVGEQLAQQQGQQQRRPLGLEPGRCQFVALAESTG